MDKQTCFAEWICKNRTGWAIGCCTFPAQLCGVESEDAEPALEGSWAGPRRPPACGAGSPGSHRRASVWRDRTRPDISLCLLSPSSRNLAPSWSCTKRRRLSGRGGWGLPSLPGTQRGEAGGSHRPDGGSRCKVSPPRAGGRLTQGPLAGNPSASPPLPSRTTGYLPAHPEPIKTRDIADSPRLANQLDARSERFGLHNKNLYRKRLPALPLTPEAGLLVDPSALGSGGDSLILEPRKEVRLLFLRPLRQHVFSLELRPGQKVVGWKRWGVNRRKYMGGRRRSRDGGGRISL